MSLLLLAIWGFKKMAVNLSPVGGVAVQFFTNSGAVLTGGKIFTYAAGTTTPQATFTNASGSTPHSNPIILDASGRVPSGEIWLTDGFAYKFLLKDANDVLIGTYDNISGINSNFVNFTSQQEIQTATASQTVFTLTTMQYQPGTNSLTVYVDGVNQYGPGASYAYLETNSTTVTFISGLHVGAEVKFTSVQQSTSSATSADQVSYLPAGAGAVATNVQAKLRESVSVKDFGAVGDGVADDTVAIQNALQSGAQSVYVPLGTYALTSNASATISTDVTFYGHGTFSYTGATNNTGLLLTIETGNNSITIDGLTFLGNDDIAAGVLVKNSAASTQDTLPNCSITNNLFANFRRNVSGGIYNDGCFVAGSYQLVTIANNRVRSITRAAGTGTPGVLGTSGATVQQLSSTQFIRECLHYGNQYANILGDDLVSSANNVDYDGFKFFAPDPSTDAGQYVQSTLTSYGNVYRNCRVRALKIQAIGTVRDETIIRDDDYTGFGASNEINFQYGVGMVSNCQFIYRAYNGGATSPIQTALTLVQFFQGADYTEDTGSAIVNGIQVLNSIPTGVGNNIRFIVQATVGGATVATPLKPLISVSNVSVNKNPIDSIASIGYAGTTYGTIRLDNITVPELIWGAVATNGTDTNFDIVATNVFNVDGVTTPANAKPYVTSSTGTALVYGGAILGGINQGFTNAYVNRTVTNKGALLGGSGLSDPYNNAGGAVTVQSISLADDATHEFDERFYITSRGLFAVSVSFSAATQGLFATSGDAIYTIAATSSPANLFEVSTAGTNPDVDTKFNMWYTGGKLNVKNRLGAAYVVTVTFMG
jgi:hypothetical protein